MAKDEEFPDALYVTNVGMKNEIEYDVSAQLKGLEDGDEVAVYERRRVCKVKHIVNITLQDISD